MPLEELEPLERLVELELGERDRAGIVAGCGGLQGSREGPMAVGAQRSRARSDRGPAGPGRRQCDAASAPTRRLGWAMACPTHLVLLERRASPAGARVRLRAPRACSRKPPGLLSDRPSRSSGPWCLACPYAALLSFGHGHGRRQATHSSLRRSFQDASQPNWLCASSHSDPPPAPASSMAPCLPQPLPPAPAGPCCSRVGPPARPGRQQHAARRQRAAVAAAAADRAAAERAAVPVTFAIGGAEVTVDAQPGQNIWEVRSAAMKRHFAARQLAVAAQALRLLRTILLPPLLPARHDSWPPLRSGFSCPAH